MKIMTIETPIYPHGKIEEIADDVFMIRGSIRMNRMVRITRNMAVIREGNELSLINPLRLNQKVEAELKTLGTISNIIRTGPFHGVDDPYYVKTHSARLWAQPGGTAYPEPPIDVELNSDSSLPFADGEIFEFENTKQPECVLLIKKAGGILLSCDSIQNYGDYSYNNFLAKIMLPFIGFPRTTIVGPMWLKGMSPEGISLEADFRKLLELEFDSLLSAHGTLLEKGAHAAVERAVDKAFVKT